MAEANKPGQEEVDAEQPEKIEGASVDTALNSGVLNQFIIKYNEKHPDYQLTADNEEDPRYEQLMYLHQNIKAVSKDVKHFLLSEIQSDGVKLSGQDFAGANGDVIEEYLFDRAAEDLEATPAYLEEVQGQLKQYYETVEAIGEAEKEIVAKEAELGDYKENVAAVDQIRGGRPGRFIAGVFGSPEQKAALRQARKEGIVGSFGSKSETAVRAVGREKLNEQNDATLERNRLQEIAREQRIKILHEYGDSTGIIQKAIDIATKRITESVNNADDMSLSQAEDAYDDFESLEGAGENSGIPYLPEDERDQMREQLDNAVKEKIGVEMRSAIESAPLGKGQLEKMENLLCKFTSRESVGATKDPKETREFILDHLRLIYDRLEQGSKEDGIKKLLLDRACFKMDPSVDIKWHFAGFNEKDRMDGFDQRQAQKKAEAAAAQASPSSTTQSAPPAAPGLNSAVPESDQQDSI